MLSGETLRTMQEETQAYWRTEAAKPEILGIAKGKEIGHKLADLVDEKTTALLTVKYITKHQCDSRGRKRSRSMGDLWLQDNGIYHAVNVKTGIVGSEGQPNLVSMKKIMKAIMSRQIDSYYLLIVKMSISKEGINPFTYLVDMLDWLDYVTFDSGPGQMMLRAVNFFNDFESVTLEPISFKDKVMRLMKLYEDGERRLKENRERDLIKYTKGFESFMEAGDFTVTPETQKTLNLG